MNLSDAKSGAKPFSSIDDIFCQIIICRSTITSQNQKCMDIVHFTQVVNKHENYYYA